MFTSLRSRLWLSYAFVITVALGIVSAVLLLYLARNPILTRTTLQQLNTVKQSILESSPQRIVNSADALANIARENNVRLLVFDDSRELIVDTAPDQPQIPFPRRTILDRTSQVVRDANGSPWLYSFSRLSNGQLLVVTAPRPRVPAINIFTDELFSPILQAGVAAFLLSLVLAFALSRWVADPLQQVVTAAQHYPAQTNLPIEPRGPREVQELTRAFNSMVGRVQSTQKSQKKFIANVSHELKTPLTSIQGFAQAILDETADSPESRKHAAQIIYSESDRLHRMALDLLDLARFEAGTVDLKIANVDVDVLLRNIVEKFTPQAQKAGVKLDLKISQNLSALSGDGDRLAQVFSNLVDNALKFTPAGGAVTLSAKNVGGEMEISVVDTGMGIGTEALPHLFERFYQADSSRAGGDHHGTGLGLAIVKEIVDAHGGKIGVRSRAGEGTTFTIHLPLAKT